MVTTRIPTVGTETCTGAVACGTAEVLAFALGATVFVLVFLAAVGTLHDALQAVDGERSRLLTEADAFATFENRVEDLDATPTPLAGGRAGTTTLGEAASHPGLDGVREAYDETVMSVPHYDTEYGEPFATNMAVEFGDDVAGAVAAGTGLTPQLKETLLQRSRRARSQRLSLVDHLDDEAEELESAEATLDRVVDSLERVEDEPTETFDYDELRAEWYLLADHEQTCRAVLSERQETIQDRRDLADRVDVVDTIEDYLYEPLEVTFPVLTDATALLRRVRSNQQGLARTMATRG